MVEPIFFSIIVPTFNRGHLIKTTIDSVLIQEFTNFELIIVDDGSTDNTREVVETFPDSRIVYLYKENEERAIARNTGMDIAKGKYITFLDSDDIIYPHHLSLALQELNKHNFPDVYRQAYEVKNEKGKLLFANNKMKGDPNKFILKGNYFSCIGVFLKKEVTELIQFNPDKNLSPTEDWEYWLRLSVRYKFYYNNTVTACMLQHSERSLLSFNEQKSRQTIELLIRSIENDTLFMQKRGAYLNQIKAQMYSLLCLNKILHKQFKGLTTDVLKTISLSKKEIFKRRTLAILKHYFLIQLK